jgi:gamma-glutamylcyclotransferase (GGCT)/AIG2-like uncharacterized protein YtfP/cation transport regulator ChaC
MSLHVFVYGTLRQHEPNHPLMSGAELVSEQAFIFGQLWDTGCSYPAVLTHPQSKVYGELYRINPEILSRLDRLEGYFGPGGSNHYDRVEQIVYSNDKSYSAYIYVYPQAPEHGESFASGDWKREKWLMDQAQFYYFAYGSCMDTSRFKRDGVDHLFQNAAGCGILKDYVLKYTRKASDGWGRADIVECTGGKVEGKLYEIGKGALGYLFEREGVDSNVYRPTFITIESRGEKLPNVLAFTVIDKQPEDVYPPDWYLEEILRGAKNLVSEEYYQQLEMQGTTRVCRI